MRSRPGCARVPKIPAGPFFRPSRDIQTVSPRASAVGLDVAHFQRIELVDGDGSSRFEKLAVDFDEGRISWLALCIMIIRLANQKPTVGHCSWYHMMQPCVVPFIRCFFPHRVLHFRAQSYAQHHRRTMAPNLGSLVLQHDDMLAARPAINTLINFAAIAWSLYGRSFRARRAECPASRSEEALPLRLGGEPPVLVDAAVRPALSLETRGSGCTAPARSFNPCPFARAPRFD